MKSICVYCGSNTGNNPAFADAARAMGRELVRRDWRLVYGGGHVGLMGVVADAVLQAGGQVIGVIPRSLVDREVGHNGLTDLRVVSTMHERKSLMAELSDGFVAMPGGIGTLEELFEAWTWSQLGIHEKPVGLLNVDGFYDGLIQFLQHATRSQFLKPEYVDVLLIDTDSQSLIDRMMSYSPPRVEKWLKAEQI